MIPANTRGLASPPAVVDEPPRQGLVNTRNIIILVGIVAWLAVLLLFVVPQLTRKPAQQPATAVTAQTAAEAARPATAAGAQGGAAAVPAPKAVPGPQLTISNRVFNLAGNSSGYKYVKLSLVVQFADEKGEYAKAKGDALKKLQDAFQTEHPAALSAFNDILTTTVSSKTAADLATTQGKENLRQELISKFNQALAGSSDRVTYVIFADFVMQ